MYDDSDFLLFKLCRLFHVCCKDSRRRRRRKARQEGGRQLTALTSVQLAAIGGQKGGKGRKAPSKFNSCSAGSPQSLPRKGAPYICVTASVEL